MRKWGPVRTVGARKGWDWPETEHYVTVEHDYGAHKERKYGEALCGRRGQLMTSYASSPRCKRCVALAAKYGKTEAV